MSESIEIKRRSTLEVALGFLLGILVCLGCSFASILLGALLRLRDPWMFTLLNAIALVAVGVVMMRRVHGSSYPEGVLIAVSLAFLLNVVVFAATLLGSVD
jgi:hypothetical protein